MNLLAAIPFDTLIFIALVLVASFFRWISKQAENAKQNGKEEEERPTTPIEHQTAERTDEERVRRFLEALGQPTTSKPPSTISRRSTPRKRVVVPHVGPFTPPLPPLTTKPPEPPRRVALPRQITQPPYEEKTFKPVAAETSFEVHEPTAIAPPEPPASIKSPAEAYAMAVHPTITPKRHDTDVMSLLRSPSGLRDAIILREIFGPPRSLQPLDLVGSNFSAG